MVEITKSLLRLFLDLENPLKFPPAEEEGSNFGSSSNMSQELRR